MCDPGAGKRRFCNLSSRSFDVKPVTSFYMQEPIDVPIIAVDKDILEVGHALHHIVTKGPERDNDLKVVFLCRGVSHLDPT